jgi:hypothetical protein
VEELVRSGEASATLQRPLFEVLSGGGYRTWTFNSENVEMQADVLAAAIQDEAVPYLRGLVTLPQIETALREWAFADIRRLRLPAVLILRGEPAEARRVVQEELGALRHDAAMAAEYEQAAARLFDQPCPGT